MKLSNQSKYFLVQASALIAFFVFFAGVGIPPKPVDISAFIEPEVVPLKAKEMSAGLLAFLIILAHITIIGLIPLLIASMWKIFEKAGEQGWKCLIPFYSTYIFWKISGAPQWALLTSLIGQGVNFILNAMTNVTSSAPSQGLAIIGVLAGISSLIGSVLMDIHLAKSFGKAPEFAVGLILLPTIFLPILAFLGAKYIGKK